MCVRATMPTTEVQHSICNLFFLVVLGNICQGKIYFPKEILQCISIFKDTFSIKMYSFMSNRWLGLTGITEHVYDLVESVQEYF